MVDTKNVYKGKFKKISVRDMLKTFVQVKSR